MSLALYLQKYIYDSLSGSVDKDIVYFTKDHNLDAFINNLYDKKDFLSIASLLESLSILDRNTYLLEDKEQYALYYIIFSNMFFSCLLYKRSGLDQRASALANCAYDDLSIYYKHLESENIPNREIIKAIYAEMIADFCLFIHRELMEENYNKALILYKNIDDVVQYGETCDWYWCFVKDRFRRLLLSCYNTNMEIPKLGQERIKYKISLVDNI